MKIVSTVVMDKYKNSESYKAIGNGVFKDLINKRYVVTLFIELEEGEDFQYPVEDILDRYYVNCTDYIFENEQDRTMVVEIEDGNDDNFDSLKTIQEIAGLVGKRVYNQEEGEYLILKIE